MPIRWGDMDILGHVNNAVYFRYMEQARVEWLSQINCFSDSAGDGPVIVNAHCTFIRQLKFPGDIEIRTYVGEPGRSSFQTYHEIRRLDDPTTLCAEGGAKVVWINYQSGKSTPLTDQMRERLLRTVT